MLNSTVDLFPLPSSLFPLILDGGMGTLLQERGLQAGETPEDWNVERPDDIAAIHRAYVEAGAQVIYTTTFGANRLKYHGKYDLEKVIRGALAIAAKSKSEAEVEQGKDTNTIARPETTTTAKQDKPAPPKKPLSKRDQVMVDIANGDYAAADVLIREMLEAKPNGALALNLKATMEARQGKLKEAERTLDRAIISNPRDHFAYYNMAILMLQANPDNKTAARRYYETGRAYGGPADPELEAMLK